jgi:penicillin-binding protein 1C
VKRANFWLPAKARLAALGGSFLALATLWFITLPPLLPSYSRTVSAWQPSESWLYDREGALIDSQRVNFSARRLAWVMLDEIAPVVSETVIAAEDKRFRSHSGVDWLALGSAARARLSGEKPRGASTLSMQVAAFLAPNLARPGARSWRDKLRQLRAARALEGNWSKDQILEAYLNIAGFRGEAQGIGAAALSLFGKTPATLTRDEGALIAALLPDPRASAGEIARRACRIASSPFVLSLSKESVPRQTATSTGSVRTERCPTLSAQAFAMLSRQRSLALDPGLAPHLAAKLLTQPGVKTTTTIDRAVQAFATTALRHQLLGLGSKRARDGAVVVVDNASGDVLAYVGGVGGGSTAAAVDGADAYRQAGSTLKPFLYAMVMEKGWLTPASILDDSPVQLDTASGLYVPQNYDHAFKGPVSARTALASSLNVPAVRALVIGGTEAFRDRLWDSGYHGLTEDGQFYGFSLALGSAEVTLLEQAAAYRALARGGLWSPLRIKADDPSAPPRMIMTAQAAWLVGNILSDPAARATTFGLDSALKLPFWAAVKTGTSKAMRDNWCVGYTDRYTVAVWIGNLEGDSMTAVSGTSGAAPVWREVMLALHARIPSQPPLMPAGIEARAISFAGNIESPRREYFLKGTGQSLESIVPVAARRPRITSPVSGTVFALDPDIPIDRQRMGIAVTGPVEGHRLILDRRDLGEAGSAPLILAGPGVHLLALVDPSGRVIDRARFVVR